MKRPVVGLTGSFGTGKSTVGSIFKRLGARVIDADKLARNAFQNLAVKKKIKSIFKTLDRKQIAKEVFRYPAKRKKLERLIHPYVLKKTCEELNRTKNKVVVLEVPLLFEAGFDRLCDVTISVLANPKVVTKRLAKRGFSAGEVRARQKAQLSQNEKRKRSDFIINNSGSKNDLVQKTKSVWKRIKLLND